MAQSGWRLPDELLRRVRVRCAEEGVRQNAWVEEALEAALADEPVRVPSKVLREAYESLVLEEQFVAPVRSPKKAPALGKGLVASRPKGK